MGIWDIFKRKGKSAESHRQSPITPAVVTVKEIPRTGAADPDSALRELMKSRRLRPLGNRDRLTHTDGDTYDVRLLLFRDRQSAERYYRTLLEGARRAPPPCLLEMMLVHLPRSIYDEKYAVVMPSEQTDNRPAYCAWALNAVRTANETLRIHNSTDHKYKELSNYVAEVYTWDILLPGGFDLQSGEADPLLTDPPGGGFNMVNWVDTGAAPPGKPDPKGPWIGVLIEQKQFAEPLNEKTGTTLLIKRAGAQHFLGSIIHGAAVDEPDPCWCVAVHTESEQQAVSISERVREMFDKEYLSFFRPEVVREPEVELSGMPFLGYVAGNGSYREGDRTV